MNIKSEPYILLNLGHNDWRFEENEGIQEATLRLDAILEHYGHTKSITSELRKFLILHSNHIDGLHHYAICKRSGGKNFEAYFIEQTAVAIGRLAFPKEFITGRDKLDTGFIQNRPFLRAMHGLMIAQYGVGLIDYAANTGRECLQFDSGDRMGARLFLPYCLIDLGLNKECLELFSKPSYEGTFEGLEYLHALLLFNADKLDLASITLNKCLHYHPYIAKYILSDPLFPPENESKIGGVISGSEYEGWVVANEMKNYWRKNHKALIYLEALSKPLADANWARYKGKV